MANTETVTGGTGADTITLGTGFTTAMQIDLGTGVDKLTLAAGGNTGSVSNVETLIGPRPSLSTPLSPAAPSISAPATTR